MRYKGTTSGTGVDNRTTIMIFRIYGWRAPTYGWSKDYKRIASFRYCSGYKKTATNHRTVEACANWVKKVDDEAKYFFFRHQSNWHCSPCPQSYTGHPTRGTAVDNNTRIFIYRIIGWKPPSWMRDYKRVAMNRYCTGYKKSAFNHRSLTACANWVRKTDREARYFFFRHEGNYHCSPCPQSYTGHPTTGTGHQNSRIHIHRYCTGYKKTATNHRNVTNCANWVKSVDPEARYFFFREQSNWHCSPCPLYYNGSTTNTAEDKNTRIHIYKITGWKAPTFKW
jgi:FPC/CPF motif-containing protein YcgG